MEENFRKLLLPIVYNGLSATVFCVTRKIVHTATGHHSSTIVPCVYIQSPVHAIPQVDIALWGANEYTQYETQE